MTILRNRRKAETEAAVAEAAAHAQVGEYYITDPDARNFGNIRVQPGQKTVQMTAAQASFFLGQGLSTIDPAQIEADRKAQAEKDAAAQAEKDEAAAKAAADARAKAKADEDAKKPASGDKPAGATDGASGTSAAATDAPKGGAANKARGA